MAGHTKPESGCASVDLVILVQSSAALVKRMGGLEKRFFLFPPNNFSFHLRPKVRWEEHK
jgi:hypothetical protein